jgi:hypothetical protein
MLFMKGRAANNPKRRIAPPDRCTAEQKAELAQALSYVGSATHKKRPGDYGFHPPANPRPHKSLCDGERAVLREEAASLMKKGIELGMFSDFAESGVPKYIWSVTPEGKVFEAKTNPAHERVFHGYQLNDDDSMKAVVLSEWRKRCPLD